MKESEIIAGIEKFCEFYKDKGYEKGESQAFWLTLLSCLDIENPNEYISFEDRVMLDHTSFIDGYIPATHVLIEQKGKQRDLDKAIKQSDGSMLTPFQQAKRYSAELPYSDRPRWIITCNFKEFRIYDMQTPNAEPGKLKLENLPKEYYRLNFLIDTKSERIKKEIEVSVEAGKIVGKLYEALLKQYRHPDDPATLKSINVLCVRLVFCMYAEDAGIFGKHGMFSDFLKKYDAEDVREQLIKLFEVLNTPEDERDPYLKAALAAFPYVNGGLFAQTDIEIPAFNDEIIGLLVKDAGEEFDWCSISPTVFGACFESTLNPETRRSGGMHYTSIENIHKVIDPLFLNDLQEELDEILAVKTIVSKRQKLDVFQSKLASLNFMDPACGSGNFLTETYLCLRRLENKVIAERIALEKGQAAGQVKIGEGILNPIKVSIGQFSGIEINDFAVAVAKTALWIAESQMMQETEKIVHLDLNFLPLKTDAHIVEGNALTLDWNEVCDKNVLNYIMGNPPFVGASMMTAEQKKQAVAIFGNIKLSNSIDFVGAWYYLTAKMMQDTDIKAALVSTNSITQGEQVAPLWGQLLDRYHVHIDFAYKTFRWDSEASEKAHVHCVIIGFSCVQNVKTPILYYSETYTECNHINPYFVDGPDVLIASRSTPICDVPKLTMGNKPTDNGNFILTEEEKENLVKEDPKVEICIRQYVGARDFLNNDKIRYCLWLKNIDPSIYRNNKKICQRLEAIKTFRENSTAAPTRKFAERPYLFFSSPQTEDDYLIIPRVSSQRRKYIPIGFMNSTVIAADSCSIIMKATLYHFGVLISNVHNGWMRTVAGRLKSDYRYSGAVVYNNFPWPSPTDDQKAKIEKTAQGILDARANHPDSSLADLYDPLTMPGDLLKAHQDNDRAVMQAYGLPIKGTSESDCVAHLMKMYEALTKGD